MFTTPVVYNSPIPAINTASQSTARGEGGSGGVGALMVNKRGLCLRVKYELWRVGSVNTTLANYEHSL